MTLEDKFIKADRYSLLRTTLVGECEKIAEEFAIGFAEWCFKKYNIISCYDMQELLKIYKKENKL